MKYNYLGGFQMDNKIFLEKGTPGCPDFKKQGLNRLRISIRHLENL